MSNSNYSNPFSTWSSTTTATVPGPTLSPQQFAQYKMMMQNPATQPATVTNCTAVSGTTVQGFYFPQSTTAVNTTYPVYPGTYTSGVQRPPTKADHVLSSVSRLQYRLESAYLASMTSGVIRSWLAKNSPGHRARMLASSRAIDQKFSALRAFVGGWEPGKAEA